MDLLTRISPTHPFGFLFVHFREGADGEQIHFTLAEGDDPLRWRPLLGGHARLRSDVGTRGVRDPFLVRDGSGGFHILATDLKVETGREPEWDSWVRTGSRCLVIWDSMDLLEWGSPRLVEIAPPSAGMAWAPEVTVDPVSAEHIVFWSSRLYDQSDGDHSSDSYSRILYSRTTDFVHFTPAEILIDTGRDIIDTALAHHGGVVHRISKDENRRTNSLGVHHEVGSGLFADDYRTLATRIGAERYPDVEGPILFQGHDDGYWYLFLDQYSESPQGYTAFRTDSLDTGRWEPVPSSQFHLPAGTKHGSVLSLRRDEWERLATQWSG